MNLLPVCRINRINVLGMVRGLEMNVAALGDVDNIAYTRLHNAAINFNFKVWSGVWK